MRSAARTIARLKRTITNRSAGPTTSASSVRRQSIWTMIENMPIRSAAEVTIVRRPFIRIVCTAKVSAVTRYMRSPTWRRLWNMSERRCRCE
jgi:hypothetical protein